MNVFVERKSAAMLFDDAPNVTLKKYSCNEVKFCTCRHTGMNACTHVHNAQRVCTRMHAHVLVHAQTYTPTHPHPPTPTHTHPHTPLTHTHTPLTYTHVCEHANEGKTLVDIHSFYRKFVPVGTIPSYQIPFFFLSDKCELTAGSSSR